MEDREKRRGEFSCFSLPLPPLAVFKDLRYEDGWDGKRGEVGRDENLTMGAGDKVGGRQRSYSHRWARGRELGGVSPKICRGWMVFGPSGGGKTGLSGEDQERENFAFSGQKNMIFGGRGRKRPGGGGGLFLPVQPTPLPTYGYSYSPPYSRSAEIVTRRPDSAVAAV